MEQVSFAALGAWVACALLATELFFRFRAHQREEAAALEPNPPLHKEYVSRAEHEALRAASLKADEAIIANVEARFTALDKNRRDNVDKLHAKVETVAERNASANETLRREVKADTEGVYRAINAIAKDVHAMSGALSVLSKNSSHPFSSK